MIVGAKVEQRISVSDEPGKDQQEVILRGTVVACDRSGSPACYHALVMLEDGTLSEVDAELLTVVELAATTRPKKEKP